MLSHGFLFTPDTDVVLTHNKSGRFESRFVSVGIQESPSVWLRGMEGSALGVWVAHGEGAVCRAGHVVVFVLLRFCKYHQAPTDT